MATVAVAVAPRAGGHMEDESCRMSRPLNYPHAQCPCEVNRATFILSPTCFAWTHPALHAMVQRWDRRETCKRTWSSTRLSHSTLTLKWSSCGQTLPLMHPEEEMFQTRALTP